MGGAVTSIESPDPSSRNIAQDDTDFPNVQHHDSLESQDMASPCGNAMNAQSSSGSFTSLSTACVNKMSAQSSSGSSTSLSTVSERFKAYVFSVQRSQSWNDRRKQSWNDQQLAAIASNTLPKDAVNSLSFQDKQILRGTPVAVILQSRGRILCNNNGSAETYRLSKPVRRINTFISHNWSTPRWQKFKVLSLYFMLARAVQITLATALLAFALTAFGKLPLLLQIYGRNSVKYEFGAYCIFLGPLVFVITLVFDFLPSGQLLFLDKTCIHQEDKQLKQRGVQSLATFVRHSDRMLAIYSDTYLQKLWTVYELASFLALRPNRQLVVMPLFIPDVVVKGMLWYTLYYLVYIIIHMTVVHSALTDWGLGDLFRYFVLVCIGFPPVLGFCSIFRQWLQEAARIHTHVANFSIANAKCSLESDRTIVQGNIASLMKLSDRVEPSAPEERALEAFDSVVRTEVPLALTASFGRVGIRYRHVLVIFLSQVLFFLDSAAAGQATGRSVGKHMTESALHAGLYFAGLPLTVALISLLTKLTLSLTGLAGKACVLGTSLLAVMFASFLTMVLETLKERVDAEASDANVGVLICTVAALTFAAGIVYRPHQAPGAQVTRSHASISGVAANGRETNGIDMQRYGKCVSCLGTGATTV